MKLVNYSKINMDEELKNDDMQVGAEDAADAGVASNDAPSSTPSDAPAETTETSADPLATLQKQADEYKAGWQRALADYENVKRDLSARAEEARRAIRAGLASDLLPVVDNFAQAVKFQPDLSGAPEDVRKKIEPWLQGILYIEKQFEEALKQMGVERIATDGKFDPKWHEAAGEKHEDGREPNTILEVLIPGWKIGELVLRPAKVIVQK